MTDETFLTLTQLQGVCMTIAGQRACVKYLTPLNTAMSQYKINTRIRISMFLAQVAHESQDFLCVEENLNYSADGLANTWASRYAETDGKGGYMQILVHDRWRNRPNALGLTLEHKPRAIANHVYANRYGNGSEASGDGWRFRGAGLKQLTFKTNHEEFGKTIGMNVSDVPSFLLTPIGAALSAAWFWGVRELNALADVGAFAQITRRINGGSIGIRSRNAYLLKAQRAMME